MWKAFTPQSPYKKRARSLAWLWTLLIFTGCLWPGKEIPRLDVPLADKWAHFVLFGGFSFLWLCACHNGTVKRILQVFATAFITGWFAEVLQRELSFLGRAYDLMDIVANTLGGILGILVFLAGSVIAAQIRRGET